MPLVMGDGKVALIRGSFIDDEIAAYRAAAREAATGAPPVVSDPPATVPGSATTTLGDRTMTAPFEIEQPPATGGDRFRCDEYEGVLLVLTVKGTEEGVDTANGSADVIVADVTIVEGDNAGEVFDGAWIFGRVLYGQLKRKIGRTFVGRIVKGPKQQGKNPPWQLDPVSDADQQRAVEFMRKRLTPPPAGTTGSTPAEGPAPTDVGDVPPWERR